MVVVAGAVVSSFLGSSTGFAVSAAGVAAGTAAAIDTKIICQDNMARKAGPVRPLPSLEDLPAGAGADSVLAGSEAAAGVVEVAAGVVSVGFASVVFFSSFFLKMALNLAFKLLSASGAVVG